MYLCSQKHQDCHLYFLLGSAPLSEYWADVQPLESGGGVNGKKLYNGI